jgi:hypothetical protein
MRRRFLFPSSGTLIVVVVVVRGSRDRRDEQRGVRLPLLK